MQQVYLRDDIHEFSNSLEASKFNQKNIHSYKKRILTKNTIKIKSSIKKIIKRNVQQYSDRESIEQTGKVANEITPSKNTFSSKNFDKIMTMKSFHSKSLNKRSKTNPIEDYEDYSNVKHSQAKRANHLYTESTGFSHGRTSFANPHGDASQARQRGSRQKEKTMTSFFSKKSNKKENSSKKQTIVVEDGQNQEQNESNKFNSLTKQFNKGPIKQKYLEKWLDSLLIECSVHQNFSNQPGTQNEGLKRYLIDPVSLSSQGVAKKDIERIYKGLFVYSIGFNNLLKQVSSSTVKKVNNKSQDKKAEVRQVHKTEVHKTIWKVFSALIEYCAQGSFQCIVAEIERDKVLKLQEYKQELERKQILLQKKQMMNEESNVNMVRENKRLIQDNFSLKNERNALLEDFQLTQQAFNEEVLIRIKYENRINEVYGIHRELGNKHMILYQDLLKKKEELSNVEALYMKLMGEYSTMKFKLSQRELALKNMQIETHYQKNLIASLDQEKNKIKALKNDISERFQQCKAKLQYQDKKDALIKGELENLQQLVDFRTKSAYQTNREYQIALEENRRLYTIISSQRSQLETLLSEKKAFNHRTLAIITESSINQKKFFRKNQQCERLYKKLSELQEKKMSLQLQLEIQKKNNGSYFEDLNINYQNIKKMHQANYLLQQELETLRKKSCNIDSLMSTTYGKLDQMSKKIEDLSFQLTSARQCLSSAESKRRIEGEQFQSQIEHLKKVNQKLWMQNQFISGNDSDRRNTIQQKTLELEKYKELFKNTLLDWKNEKFQRHNLKLKYDQILVVMESKNKENKEKAYEISELKGFLQAKQKELEIANLRYEQEKRFSEQYQQKSAGIIQKLKEQIKKKAYYAHPMVQEDLKQRLARLTGRHNSLQILYREIKETFQEQKKTWEEQRINMVNSYQAKIESMTKEMQLVNFQKDTEIKYEKIRGDSFKVELQKYKQLEIIYKAKIEERKTSEREQHYMKIIQDKKKNIAVLLKDLQIAHDQISYIKVDIQNKNRELSAKENEIIQKVQQIFQIHEKRNQDKTKYQQEIQILKTNYENLKRQYIQLDERIQIIAQQRMNNKIKLKTGLTIEGQNEGVNQNKRVKDNRKDRKGQFNSTNFSKMSETSKRRFSMGKTIQNTYQYYSKQQQSAQ